VVFGALKPMANGYDAFGVKNHFIFDNKKEKQVTAHLLASRRVLCGKLLAYEHLIIA